MNAPKITLVSVDGDMRRYEIEAGSVLHVHGIPVRLVEAVEVETATDLEAVAAMPSAGEEKEG